MTDQTMVLGTSRHSIGAFLRAYVRSMRLYYAFVTGIAGWIGVAYARFLHPDTASLPMAALTLGILFLSWGINQIVNDYLGLAEDRVNAPHRPMVTGELNPRAALTLSFSLLALAVLVTWRVSPWALIPLLAGIGLNVIYEYAKGVPVLGNVVFGLMISMCTTYGFLATNNGYPIVFTTGRLSVLLLVAIMNGLMTYYTYFKDYAGDRAAGKITAVVMQGIQRARTTAIAGSFLPSVVLWALIFLGAFESTITPTFVFLFAITLFLQIWTGVLYYKYPSGPRAYLSLVTNFRACTGGQVLLIAFFNPELALYLYVAAYVFIGFLFGLHGDHQA
ncbi:MAG: UbiA family prenyltransferase [Candidatus Eisenbacteria bacterium]